MSNKKDREIVLKIVNKKLNEINAQRTSWGSIQDKRVRKFVVSLLGATYDALNDVKAEITRYYQMEDVE